MANILEDNIDDIVEKIGVLAGEVEVLRVQRALGYIKDDKVIAKYSELQKFEDYLVEEYEARDLYKVVKKLEFYYGDKNVKGINIINKSICNLKENLYEYVVLSENLDDEESSVRESKINGFIEQLEVLSNKGIGSRSKLTIDEKFGRNQEMREIVDSFIKDIVSSCSSGDLRYFLDRVKDKYSSKNTSLVVRYFLDSIKSIDIVNLSIDEFFSDKFSSKKESLDDDELSRIVNDSLVLSSRYDYFDSCCRLGCGFDNSLKSMEINLENFSNSLIRKYNVGDLYRIVQGIDSYLKDEDITKSNNISSKLRMFIYDSIKDGVVEDKKENIDEENVLGFSSDILEIANLYARIGTLSGDEAKAYDSFVLRKIDSFVDNLFDECNSGEIDRIVVNVYEQCRENRFRNISGVKYVVDKVNDEKRDRVLKKYFDSKSINFSQNK